jgi:hypothetical protein
MKRRVPRDLRSPSERPVPMRGAEQPLPTAGHLASRGIHLVVCPSSDNPRPRPLQVTLPSPSVRWLPHQPTRSALVVSHHLDGFLRVRGPGLVASRYRKGFAGFLCLRAPLQSIRRSLVRCARGVPACASTPLEEVPPPAAAPHRCGRCPLVVGPPRSPVAGVARRPSTSRPCSAVGSVATAAVASFGRPLLPWASFPSRVLGGTGLRPDASPHRPSDLAPPTGPGVATGPCRLPRSRDRPPVLPTPSTATSLPPIGARLLPAMPFGSKSVRGSPFAIGPTRRRAEARRGPVRDRGPSWGC